jgi:hypothetical protein
MPGETKSGMACSQFEALLSDALDGRLSGPALDSFRRHRELCAECGPLFAQAEAGLNWLKSLPEIGPPAGLTSRILAATSGAHLRPVVTRPAAPSLGDRVRAWVRPVVSPVWGTVRQPRFAMSFAMAFFSVSIALNAVGVRLGDLRRVDLRPSALVRSYYESSAKVVKYYENIRFVYELESRVRDLKRATEPEEPSPPAPQKNPKHSTSGTPEQNRQQNYSRDDNQPLMASYPANDSRRSPLGLRRDV